MRKVCAGIISRCQVEVRTTAMLQNVTQANASLLPLSRGAMFLTSRRDMGKMYGISYPASER